jgi:nucleoside-diphosphate-sugar epimerase
MTSTPKIYVAGHCGMVGSAIVRQLQAMGCHVVGAPRNDGKGAVVASAARQSMQHLPNSTCA